ncbi:MAG: hypothetical protein CMH98_19060 [Oceanospirillaceae bacterium]|nr:hypothetical protein [Oceanospirillaceae bacterium]
MLERALDEIETGFVACERCGDQEDTNNLDFVDDLKTAREELLKTIQTKEKSMTSTTIQPAEVNRDEDGFWIHPDYPEDWEDDPDLKTEPVRQWEKNNKIQLKYTTPDVTGQTLKEWQPEIPENCFLISVFAADCGHVAMYAIPQTGRTT